MFHRIELENPDMRLNDDRTDRKGWLIVGGMKEGSGAADSSVLRVERDLVERDLSVSVLFGGVSCANSTCFSPDGSSCRCVISSGCHLNTSVCGELMEGLAQNRGFCAMIVDGVGRDTGELEAIGPSGRVQSHRVALA